MPKGYRRGLNKNISTKHIQSTQHDIHNKFRNNGQDVYKHCYIYLYLLHFTVYQTFKFKMILSYPSPVNNEIVTWTYSANFYRVYTQDISVYWRDKALLVLGTMILDVLKFAVFKPPSWLRENRATTRC